MRSIFYLLDRAVICCSNNRCAALTIFGAASLITIVIVSDRNISIFAAAAVALMLTIVAYCTVRIYSSLRPMKFDLRRLLTDSGTHISRRSTAHHIRISREDSAICAELRISSSGIVERIRFLHSTNGLTEKRPERDLSQSYLHNTVEGYNLRFTPFMAVETAAIILSTANPKRRIKKSDILRYLSGVSLKES